jgi:O-antigen/teichoic acid export membrane protein
MKTNSEDIDQLIKETLTQEEAKFYDDLEEQSFLQMVLGIFSGKNSWLVIVMSIVQVIFFGVFVYCAIQFFEVEATNELIKWGVFGTLSFMVSSMLKLFSWMQMDKKAIIREIKRLELQVSSLSVKISE